MTAYDLEAEAEWAEHYARAATSSARSTKGAGRTVGEHHRGQLRLGYRLEAMYTDRLMHVASLGWLAWDGRRWAEDRTGRATQAVLHVLRDALAESLHDRELREDVRRCESAAGVRGILELAGTMPGLARTVEMLDADPHVLNTQSGLLNLATGALLPYDPAMLCTKITTASYRPDGDIDGGDWARFLRQALPDDGVRGYFQRLTGLALLGTVREHQLPILMGSGGNGKGVAYGAILHALGDYGYAAESDLFTSAKANANAASPALMGLRGRRLVVVSETERDQPLAEALVKLITGGDPITARPLYGKPVTFIPSHQAWMVTNNLPKVRGDDEAIWRRLRVLPFDVSFRDHPDTGLGERLRAEADQVLAWAVQGWFEYQRIGLAEPDAVKVATGRYRQSSDGIARFLAEACVTNPHAHVGHRELLTAWRSWCADTGELPGSERDFAKAIENHGHPGRRTNLGRRYGGLALLAEEDG